MVKDNGNSTLIIALAGIVAFVLGLIVGLPILGWWLWPVVWEKAGPEHLSPYFKVEYVKLVADSYAYNGDPALAQERMDRLKSDARQAVADTLRTAGSPEVFQLAQTVGEALPPGEVQNGDGQAGEDGGWTSLILPVCAAVIIFLLLLVGGFFLYMRFAIPKSKGPPRTTSGVQQGSVATRVETPPEIAAVAGAEPVTTFKTTYMLGNDLFDESFSIDDQQGDFLGECGVGIGETIGVGDPKKVTAFEVWLFDKNDIRTVTKVLMTEHAFNDESLKSRLAAKGEPALAKPGGVVEMETATLKVAARIVDMQYGSGALPPNSFFQQLTLEISAWKKGE